jgi:hypothetical protein
MVYEIRHVLKYIARPTIKLQLINQTLVKSKFASPSCMLEANVSSPQNFVSTLGLPRENKTINE